MFDNNQENNQSSLADKANINQSSLADKANINKGSLADKANINVNSIDNAAYGASQGIAGENTESSSYDYSYNKAGNASADSRNTGSDNTNNADGNAATGDTIRKNNRSSLLILLVIIVVYILFTLIAPAGTCNNNSNASTTKREKLDVEVQLTDYFSGTSIWSQAPSLENQMQYFYDKTGCQPYLLDLTGEAALTEDQLAQKADDFYKKTFTDQAHLLVVFQADETNAFRLHILPGTDAAMVMDKEACDILKANIEKFAADPKMDTDLVMPNAFAQSADDIMQGGRNNTVLIIILVVVVLAAYFLTSRRKTGVDSGQGSSYLGGLFGGRR